MNESTNRVALVTGGSRGIGAARASRKTATEAAELVGWSRATLYRHQASRATEAP